MNEVVKRRLAFGDQLRQVRESAGLSGKGMAELLGWQPSKISRLEHGKQQASDSDVHKWCAAASVPDPLVAQIRDELREIRMAEASWRRQLRSGHQPRQRRGAELERSATLIQVFELSVVPGLLQTPDYARQVFAHAAALHQTPHDTEEAVQTRLARQSVLDAPDRRVEILLTESALRYPVCASDVLAEQVDRLAELAAGRSFRLGLIPLGTRVPAVPMHGFSIVDDRVLVETTNSELVVDDPDERALYQRLITLLWSVALEGGDAQRLLERLGGEIDTERPGGSGRE